MGFTLPSPWGCHSEAGPRAPAGLFQHDAGVTANRMFPKVTLAADSDTAGARGAWHLTHCEHDLTYFMLSGSTGVKDNLHETRRWWNHDQPVSLTHGLWVGQLGDTGPFPLCRSQRRSALPKKHDPHSSSHGQRRTGAA